MTVMRFIPFLPPTPTVAVIRLQGVIAAGSPARLNDASLAPLIERAFSRGKPKAVALMLNSPGGSPVQSSLIAARIRRLADEKKLPVFAFVEDVAASGGYWLATAADEIFADESSIVGSIGVISAGFGLDGFIERYGIERRVYTAGKSKSMLDPFRPEQPDDVARLKLWQDQIHQCFIDHVKARRGARLADDDDLFTGEVWVGRRARDVGLIDGIGDMATVMRDRFGKNAKFISYRQRRPFLSRFGAGVLDAAAGMIEDRAAYARYGL